MAEKEKVRSLLLIKKSFFRREKRFLLKQTNCIGWIFWKILAPTWQTDKNTQIHVASLKAKLDAFSASDDHKIAAYHVLASDLSKELKELISNCKMEGKAHDALHLWLVPVLKDVENLQNVATTDIGKNTLKHLNNSIKEFNNYFI